MTDHEPTTDPDSEPDPDSTSHDPRNQEVHGDEGMPAEFIDTPSNRPGSQTGDDTPPNPATVDDD